MPDDGGTLLAALRERLGVTSVKDGCSPQGQCGCCTVWVDGAPRVACVTPARRVAGRAVTTTEGLPAADRDRWAQAFTAHGASQCGFCTPGIIMRLAGLESRRPGALAEGDVANALLAHLCRCTGWRSVIDAAVEATDPDRPLARVSVADGAARARALVEGGVAQDFGPHVALGRGGFADDTAPADALVAVPDGTGGWAVGETLAEARAASGKIQGRRTTLPPGWPIDPPPGDWALTLATTWVEPAYLETDASWCVPGGDPASPLANGGAFGAKTDSPAPAAARALADAHGRPVRVVLSREDTVRLGPKRPPVAVGVAADGTGVLRLARTPGVAAAVRAFAPGLTVEEVDVVGPRTSGALRAAGWAEAAVVLAGARAAGGTLRAGRGEAEVEAPNGARARAEVGPDGIRVAVSCGAPLEPVVLRSYCVGAAHMALGWVRSEHLAVGPDGEPLDLTIRSFGILRAVDMPPVEVEVEESTSEPVNGSDAVFAAVAAAAWIADGLPPRWPTGPTGGQP